jgi:hypothetical protein
LLEDCGLGKTIQELVWAQNVIEHTNKPVLILTPLAVGPQTVAENEKFHVGECSRSRDGKFAAGARIVVTNYEKLHLFDSNDFAGVVCDEASILKHFTGATQKNVTRFLLKVPYRLLATATPSPNDHTELGTASEALGELGMVDMLSRFFKQDPKIHALNEKEKRKKLALLGQRMEQRMMIAGTGASWRLKGHAVTPFWKWVASWARACRMPSDLGFENGAFVLPELIEREHIVVPNNAPDDRLFTVPAFGLQEERSERRRTLKERCELVARPASERIYSMIWCQLNVEGDELERIIPHSIQVSGSDSEDYKEAAIAWFRGDLCICNLAAFRAKLAAWPKEKTASIRQGIEPNGANSGAPIQKNTTLLTKSSERNITPLTTLPIESERPSGQGHDTNGTSQLGWPQENSNTQPIRISSSETRESGDLLTHEKTRISNLENTGSPPTTTIESSLSREESARCAETRTETGGDIASTLITAISLESLEGCSVPVATLASDISEMIRKGSSASRCICGHEGGPRRLISKSKIFGFGLNLQFCSHVVTFATHSYESYYQQTRRCWRFGQTRPVTVDIISSEAESYVRENMRRKAEASSRMFTELVKYMRETQTIDRVRMDVNAMELPAWVS